MKRYIKILTALIIILYSFIIIDKSFAQVIKGALIGGLNLSQVDGDQIYGFHKAGLNVGASAIIPIKNRFSLDLEILYSQKGSSQKPLYNYEDSSGEYMLKLNYAEIPLLLQYSDKGGVTVGAGFSYGRLVYVAEKQSPDKNTPVQWDNVSLNDGTYKKSDYEVIGDLQFRLFQGFYLDLRYSYSMAEIRKRYFYKPFNKLRKQYNNLISCRLIWVINEKKIEETKKSITKHHKSEN